MTGPDYLTCTETLWLWRYHLVKRILRWHTIKKDVVTQKSDFHEY